MSLFKHQCPHCNTNDVLFQSVADVVVRERLYTLFMVCNHCSYGITVLVKVELMSVSRLNIEPASPHKYEQSIGGNTLYKVLKIFPEGLKLSAPAFVPTNIASYYIQALDNLHRGHYDASGMMFRKVLDVSTKELGSTKDKLWKRIDELAEKHDITPAMREWAHAIRLDGNDAAHEDEPFDKETCEDLKSFTELFLMYAFTLTAMLKERRAKKSS